MSSEDLLEYVKELFKNTSDFLEDEDEDSFMYVKTPTNYSPIPTIDLEIEGHTVLDLDTIKKYFLSIEDMDMRIHEINGMRTMPDIFGLLYCDYCNTSMLDQNATHYFYCWECRLDMCALCLDETDSEKAKANAQKG